MQLLKVRNFSDFFSDTFQFIKENGKHFFTNYFIINGIFLLLMLVKNYSVDALNPNFGLMEFLYLILQFIFSIINWSFVTIYMILYRERGIDFNHRDILAYYRKNIGKIVLFILVSILLFIPVVIVFYILLFLTFITIVGPFLVMAGFVTWFSLAFYEYLYTDRPVFDCFGYAFTLLKKKFWAITGSTALLYFIVLIINGFILSALGVFSSFVDMNVNNSMDKYMEFAKAFSSSKVLVVMTLLSVLYVLLQIVQGIIYFSQKELVESISTAQEIDEIGNLGNDNIKF